MKIDVKARYLAEESLPEQHKYVFAYTIQIKNTGNETAKLVSRYWHICDANDQIQEVQGLGVVGEQPSLAPNETYTYTSGAVIATPTGSMRGHYTMQQASGSQFIADIPEFLLAVPQALH